MLVNSTNLADTLGYLRVGILFSGIGSHVLRCRMDSLTRDGLKYLINYTLKRVDGKHGKQGESIDTQSYNHGRRILASGPSRESRYSSHGR